VPQLSSDPQMHQANEPSGAWLWMDITTSWRARHGQMNGTLRVEQSYAEAIGELIAPRLRYCRYHRTRQCFIPVSAYPDLSGKPSTASRSVARRKSSALRALGRRVERTLRNYRREIIGSVMNLGNRMTANGPGLGGPGEVLFLAGESWGQYDFNVVARLRAERGTHIAALCQDLIPITCPQFFESGDFVARYRAYVDFLIRDADLIVAISESTKSDILTYARQNGGIRGHIAVVQLGADLISAKLARPPSDFPDLRTRKFVLSVSTIQSRKNFDLLYHLWRRLAEQKTPDLPMLVIVGQRGYGSQDLLWQIEHDDQTKDKIAILHHTRDEELSWLYQNCLWTMYPSFYEGWGLPISESLAYGKYCLASNSSSMPEAGAGLANHLDPLDFAAWRDATVELIRSPAHLATLESSIRARYRPTTWQRSAEVLLNELKTLFTVQPTGP
jgi:glycosyltransferase involved in cell wall biosynthesis